MTFQVCEQIIYKGRKNYVRETPLEAYLSRQIDEVTFGCGLSSGCWRGYEGTWVIEEGRLYLIGLEAFVDTEDYPDGANVEGVFSLEDLFPGFGDGAFAHWYTGSIYMPINPSNIDFDYAGIDEELEKLTFVNGICQKTELVIGREYDFNFCELEAEREPLLTPPFLKEKVDIWAVEKKNLISDPFGRVPLKPFGFLNDSWNAFLDNRHFADELWSAKIPKGVVFSEEFTSTFDIEGYVFIKNNEFVAEFIL